jgi:enterochelin esterase-like enzyme
MLIRYGSSSKAQLPCVVSGELKRYENFSSIYITTRTIDVWLPPGYTQQKKYAVLYMHDGQMLFDSNSTWNKQAWEIDDVLTNLLKENKIKEVIVVGIWNSLGNRHADYFPQRPFRYLTAVQKNYVSRQLQSTGHSNNSFQPVSDNYLKFIVKELKPFIDKTYSTFTNRQNTFIAGSSMGGLISLYAICEYPKIFGGAACLSTHWPGIFTMENNPVPAAFLKYLGQYLPSPATHKLYFDCGDQTLDTFYPPIQHKVDSLVSTKGYSNNNWMTRYFPGEEHSERAWHKRVETPLLFLLGKNIEQQQQVKQ